MSRSNTKKSPYLALTSSYVISLSMVALLFIGANILLADGIEDQRKVAMAINLAGRQNMLCQRIAWLATRYAEQGEIYARQQLQAAVTEMAITADNLRTGHIDTDAAITVPASVAKIYADQKLSDHLRTFLTHARVLLATDIPPRDSNDTRPANDDMAAIIVEANGPLLTALNDVGTAYVQESNAQIARLRTNQRITLAAIILTLAGVALFIFRPLVGKVSTYVDEVLEHSRKASAARRVAQQASAAKSAFLSNMSHELRTPMTGIMGICDLLRSSPLSAEQAKMTRMLHQSAQILLDLLNDILDLAKIEAGRISLESIDFDLSALLADVRNLFDGGMAEKGLAFTIETAPDRGDVFRGDPKHIRQILCNLVGNALKFTESGSVAVRSWRETATDGRILLRFEVIDSGIGISEEGQLRMFRKFEQEERSTSRRYGGTGLGLAICKQLSEAMGGGIGVKSTKGLGSTFSVHVRVDAGDPATVTAAAVATPVQAGYELQGLTLNILLAEDNLTTQFIITRMLSLWGQTVVTVADGKIAVARAAQERFDVILMDMQMPAMDGDEATRRIRAGNGASAAAPILALTADGILEHHQRYLDAGCDVVLTKPIVWAALAHEIRSLVGLDSVTRPPLAALPPPLEEDPEPVLNPSMFSGLREALSADDLEEILRQFLDSMATYHARLEANIAAEDHTQVQRTAHSLKGLCAQIGADEVASIAAWIEDQSIDIISVQEIMPQLEDHIARVRAAVLKVAPDAAQFTPQIN